MKPSRFFLILSLLFLIFPGCKKTDSSDPLVNDPYAMFKFTKKANGIVTFTNTSTDATSFLWDFGDLTTSTSSAPTIDHQYLKNGTYKATLTAYGNGKSTGAYADLNITTVVGETVTDIDGNVYRTVTIGTQVWTVENLKTTKLNDGTPIPLLTDNTEWRSLTTPGYSWYNNDAATYKTTYGALYNWHAVNTGKLAPTGWHVPTDAELTILTTYLGGEGIAGGKMKSTGTIEAGTGLWYSPNTGATNESGFTAVPAGSRSLDGTFGDIGDDGYWWSSSEYGTNYAWSRDLYYGLSTVGRSNDLKNFGLSVRCLRD